VSEQEPLRVPMKQRPRFKVEDVDAGASDAAREAYRFNFDVAVDALRTTGVMGLNIAVERLTRDAIQRYQGDIDAMVVNHILGNEEWARPIIERAIGDAVHRIMLDMFKEVEL
jgi:hypothetical protein